MSTQVNRRRGTTAQHAVFTGAVGETTYDTDLKRVVAHDGALAGGFPAATLHLAQTFALTQTFAATENFFGSTATAANKISFLGPAGMGSSTLDFRTNGTPDLNFLRKYSDTPFQIELAGSAGIDLIVDSNNNETGSSVRFLTNGIRGSGTQTLLFTVFDNTNATLVGNFTANQLLLPNTTSALVGGIYFGGNRAFHNFGTDNIFVGVNAGNFTLSGGFNVFVGVASGLSNTTGFSNAFVGTYAGFSNTTGNSNTFFGTSAGIANTTGSSNSFFGLNSGNSNTTGSNNLFLGTLAGALNVSGDFNCFFGTSSGQTNTASNNTFFGANSGMANTSGAENTFFGVNSGAANTTGASNTVFGYLAGDNLTTGSNNLVIGYRVDVPSAAGSNQMSIGNLIFGTGVDGTGTTISSGLVGIKVINPVTELHVVSTSAGDPRGIMSAQHSTDAIGARIHFRKSRGTVTAPTTVVTGDVLGRLRFSGYDSANYLQMGSIDVVSVGTIAATRVPTYMAFSTATDVAPSVLTERLRIDQAGKIQILTGVGADAGGFKHARVTTGSVGAGSTALVTITWTTAFADTNYTVNASVLDSTASSLSLSVVHIESITAGAVTVRVLNNAVGSLTGTVHVIAVHD